MSMIFIASLVSYELQKIEQENFASEFLANSEKVTSQLTSVLTSANLLKDFSCTDEHIDKLRELVLANSEVFDVGFIDKETVYCTANWGVISLQLPCSREARFKISRKAS